MVCARTPLASRLSPLPFLPYDILFTVACAAKSHTLHRRTAPLTPTLDDTPSEQKRSAGAMQRGVPLQPAFISHLNARSTGGTVSFSVRLHDSFAPFIESKEAWIGWIESECPLACGNVNSISCHRCCVRSLLSIHPTRKGLAGFRCTKTGSRTRNETATIRKHT